MKMDMPLDKGTAMITEKLVTIAEFEEFLRQPENKDRLWELIDGRVVEKVPTQEHGIITGNTVFELKLHCRQTKKGQVAPEVRHQMPGDEHNARLPDIAFYADDSIPVVTQGAVPRMPDLAVEVKSPDDSYREMRLKAEYYLSQGTKMVWLIYPEKRLIEVLTPDDFQILHDNEMLEGGDLLPDFRVAVADIFKLKHS